ncbi:MAG: orotidine-5'-phosphate decarboxylase [Candidatus Schekmanbacteria bacterium]|nr:orotidine-5'-phosphate decarboxylase [Candidatus Schekmanbacteria bacterium]
MRDLREAVSAAAATPGAFADRVQARVAALGSVAVLGLDPDLRLMPPDLLRRARDRSGDLQELAAWAFRELGLALIDAAADLAVAVKAQAACYERYGAAGMAALADTVAYARAAGMLAIVDGKRGDIAETMAAYGDAYLGEAAWEGLEARPFDADAMTISPYLGGDVVAPLLGLCASRGKGLFCLVRTSNPSAADLQRLQLADGSTVAEAVADLVSALNAGVPRPAASRFGPVGAVVAANLADSDEAGRLRRRLDSALILAPGFGAQGGSAEQVRPLFCEHGAGLLVTASRSLIYAYRRPELAGFEPAAACRHALTEMNRDLARVWPR